MASILAKSRENKAEFKARAIKKYKGVDKKKLLKRAALATAGAAAVGGATYGAYKWGDKGKMGRGTALAGAKAGAKGAPSAVAKAARSGASRAKFAGVRTGVSAKKTIAPMLMRGNKGLSWGKKGETAMKAATSRKRSIATTKVMHPKHWRRYVKAEGFDFTRDELIETLVYELMSE